MAKEIQEAIERADTKELLEAVATYHPLGAWGLTEILVEHGEDLIEDEWGKIGLSGVPTPPDEYYKAIALHLTPSFAGTLIRSAGEDGRELLKKHASDELAKYYEREVT